MTGRPNGLARDGVWVELDDREYDVVWQRFYQRFNFRPGMDPSSWPAINEPTPSVTLDLGVIPDGPRRAAAVDAVNVEVLRAFVWSLSAASELVVLDWQHSAYLFRPEAQALTLDAEWKVTPYPDGDYYAFMSPDLRHGTFGHPWEQTLCVMGEPLVASLEPTLGAWLPIKRRSG